MVAQQVYDKIQKAGLEPSFPQVPEPNEHPLEFIITSLTALMGVLSVMAIILSGFLVFNTISALLAQQIRQIGIMKAVGGRPAQIMGMYMVLVVCFGLLALIPAIPLARLATAGFADLMADFLNFEITSIETPVYVFAMQVAICLLVPMVAALWPILSGTHITVREALDSAGVSSSYGTSKIDRLIRAIRGLPRPVLLSLRNTFRRKGRVVLTLITLTMGGAIFISVFSIQDSLWRTIDEFTARLYNFDTEIYLERPYRTNYLQRQAQEVPGVVAAEAQIQTTARRIFAGDREGEKLQLFAVPPDTTTMDPPIKEGRWLLPADENAVVISTGMQDDDPSLQVGTTMQMKIQDTEETWHIVGTVPVIGGYRWAYVSYDYYGRVTHEVGEASYLRIIGEQHDAAYQAELASAVEEHFKRLGINVSSTKTKAELSEGDRQSIEVIVSSLMFMAVLVAVVGGLGLAGTMSLNVIERVREIGIMRAVGASDSSVLQIFMTEGVIIGMLSWTIGAVIALPVSKLMSDGMGMLLFSDPLTFSFSLNGVVIWLIISVVLAAVASFLPAWNASKVSVREVLTYE
jgi:putative ABC transport system permease protein